MVYNVVKVVNLVNTLQLLQFQLTRNDVIKVVSLVNVSRRLKTLRETAFVYSSSQCVCAGVVVSFRRTIEFG